VVQPGVDAAGAAALGIDRKTGRQGKRPLLESLGAKQLVPKRFFAIAVIECPVVGEQIPSGNPRTVPEDVPLDLRF